MIETLQEYEGSSIGVVTFRWRDTIISMAEMSRSGVEKCLIVRAVNAVSAEPTTDTTTAKWIITPIQAEPKKDVGVSITSDGSAPNATENVIPESNSEG